MPRTRIPGLVWLQSMVCLIVMAPLGSVARSQESSDRTDGLKVSVTTNLEGHATAALMNAIRGQQSQLSEYWLGVDGLPADDTMRSQLELPNGQGLVLHQVVENSPAAKAGLKQHDVILTVAGVPLTQTSELANLIAEKKEQTLSLMLIRRGKQIIVDAKPERRPSSETGDTCPSMSRVSDADFINRVTQELIGSAPSPDETKRFAEDTQDGKRTSLVNRLLRVSTVNRKSCTSCHVPADASLVEVLGRYITAVPVELTLEAQAELMIPSAAAAEAKPRTVELPDDLSITITRHGKQPAKVNVQRTGVQAWESNLDDLDKLPQEIRGYVDVVLGTKRRDLMNDLRYWQFEVAGQPMHPTPDVAPTATNARAIIEQLDQQLERIRLEYDQARKTFHELRSALPSEPAKSGDPKK